MLIQLFIQFFVIIIIYILRSFSFLYHVLPNLNYNLYCILGISVVFAK